MNTQCNHNGFDFQQWIITRCLSTPNYGCDHRIDKLTCWGVINWALLATPLRGDGMNRYNPEIHHRNSIRLRGYDYSKRGLYCVTICTYGRRPLFGEIINGEMRLNDFGQIAENEWVTTPEHRPYVVLHEFVVMPNHFHGIIEIASTDLAAKLNTHTSNAIKQPLRANECIESGDVRNTFTDISPKSGTLPVIVRAYKSAVSKYIHKSKNIPVWQRNYFENIIRSNQDYIRIAKYIINNPQKWEKDRFFKK